jgi:hypothetical protein
MTKLPLYPLRHPWGDLKATPGESRLSYFLTKGRLKPALLLILRRLKPARYPYDNYGQVETCPTVLRMARRCREFFYTSCCKA